MEKANIKSRLLKKTTILIIFCVTLIAFCIVYKNTPNAVSNLVTEIEEIAETSDSDVDVEDTFNKVESVTQSTFIQFPLRFINEIITIYFESLLILLLIKLVNVFKKDKYKIKLGYIVDAFYVALYTIIINYIIQTIYMLIVGQSIDYNVDIFAIIYQIIFAVLNGAVVVGYLKKKHNILVIPLIFVLLLIGIQAAIIIGG